MAAAGLALAKHHRKPGSYRPSKVCVDRVDEQDRFERRLRRKTREELIDTILGEPTIARQLARREAEHGLDRDDDRDDDDDGGDYRRDKYDDLRIFLIPVKDRTRETLLPLIRRWIVRGTTVYTDCFKPYDCLDDEGYVHRSVNHKVNFVSPTSGAHTQGIERVWREVRANVPKYGIKRRHLEGYLAEYMFKRAHPRERRIEAFFDAIARKYPPPTGTTTTTTTTPRTTRHVPAILRRNRHQRGVNRPIVEASEQSRGQPRDSRGARRLFANSESSP
ncbi:PREDICTED: uncharacterized protein LOC105449076 [Wasmannia auropunctata]|uniref:uncharacterized protein LOC105449076 n=1 Tax=Wasmannia auropunctata TaxID=64793 RepID=UPI0005EF51F8|nr:PREDICTED: uncharacterized protein LOC105449076 [Wasmannia auropunctata]